MCSMCEGQTFEEAIDETAARIAEHGYTLQGVEPSPGHHSWIYSIGLVANFGHPELIVVGLDVSRAADLMTCMADRVVEGKPHEPGDVLCHDHGAVHTRIGRVHPGQLRRDWFNWWFSYYLTAGGDAPELRALQVVWSDAHGPGPTAEHRWRHQPLLSAPLTRDRPPARARGRRHPKGRKR